MAEHGEDHVLFFWVGKQMYNVELKIDFVKAEYCNGAERVT